MKKKKTKASVSESKVTGKPASKVTGKPAGKVTGKSAGRVTGKPAGKVTGKPAAEVSGAPASELNKRHKEKVKKERFLRERMWFSTLLSKFFTDRGTIPDNIGNNVLVTNNVYITKNHITALFLVTGCLIWHNT